MNRSFDGAQFSTRWSHDRAFWFVVCFSILVRLLVLASMGNAPFVFDGLEYRNMAMQLLDGHSFVPYWPPGLPYYLSAFLAVTHSDVVLRAAMLFFWLLFCWGTYRLAIVTDTVKVAWIILLIFSLAPVSIHLSLEPLTQLPVAALLLVAASAAIRCGRRSGWDEYVLLGCSLGAMCLIRPSALLLLLFLPAAAFFRDRRLFRCLIAVAIGGALIFGWMIKVQRMTGKLAINSSNSYNLFYGNNPSTPLYRTWFFGSHAKPGSEEIHKYPEYETTRTRTDNLPNFEPAGAYQRMAVQYIFHHPVMFVIRSVNRVLGFWGFDIFTAAQLRLASPTVHRWFPVVLFMDALIYLIVAGFSVFWMTLAPRCFWGQWETWLLAGPIFLYALPYWVSMSHATYHYPIMMPLVFLGLGAKKVSEGSVKRVRRGYFALLVLGAVQVEWMFYLVRQNI